MVKLAVMAIMVGAAIPGFAAGAASSPVRFEVGDVAFHFRVPAGYCVPTGKYGELATKIAA